MGKQNLSFTLVPNTVSLLASLLSPPLSVPVKPFRSSITWEARLRYSATGMVYIYTSLFKGGAIPPYFSLS